MGHWWVNDVSMRVRELKCVGFKLVDVTLEKMYIQPRNLFSHKCLQHTSKKVGFLYAWHKKMNKVNDWTKRFVFIEEQTIFLERLVGLS